MIYDEETGATYHYTLKMGRDSNPLTNIVQIDEPVLKRVWDHLVDPDNARHDYSYPDHHRIIRHEYGFYLPPLEPGLSPRQVRIERDYPLTGGYDILVHVHWSVQLPPLGLWKPILGDGIACSIWRDMHQPQNCYDCKAEQERTYYLLSANAEPSPRWWKSTCR